MKTLGSTLWLVTLALSTAVAHALPPLQLFVDLTPAGGVLRPPAGNYSGPVVISKPLTLEGSGGVTVDNGGKGTVLTVRADGTTIKGLKLINSGDSHNGLDAGLLLEANGTLIEENMIENTLFGIVLNQGNNNTIRNNKIGSRGDTPSLRGDGLRLWYSQHNRIEENTIDRVRDLVFTNSSDNIVEGNLIRESRIGMEFVFSPNNRVINNRISRNLSGIVNLYSDHNLIKGNRIEQMRGATHSALAIKESFKVRIEDNQVIHCGVGLTANTPTHRENILYLTGNRLSYNDVAMYFYGERGGHVIHGNRFEGNLLHVAVSAPSSARDNDWRGNYWDDYEGFDPDGDGVGNTPHEIYLYADRIWMDRPMTSFFRSSPMLEIVDFIERLAPFSKPEMIVMDPAPATR